MKATNRSPAQQWSQSARHYLSNRWLAITLAGVLLAAGFYLNWGWLAAIGVAPVLVALAPCAIMCALGLCAMKVFGGGTR